MSLQFYRCGISTLLSARFPFDTLEIYFLIFLAGIKTLFYHHPSHLKKIKGIKIMLLKMGQVETSEE